LKTGYVNNERLVVSSQTEKLAHHKAKKGVWSPFQGKKKLNEVKNGDLLVF